MREAKRFRKVLQGLEGITVWVHNLKEDAISDGLSRQHLQDEATIRILDSGIKALSVGNVPEPVGNPWLNIFIDTLKGGQVYYYSVTVRLDEIVRPVRNQQIKTVASTWESVVRGVVQKEQMPKVVEKSMDNLIDYFIYDYWQENNY